MTFFTILHGKPNSGCHVATPGLEETFCNNIVDRFFESMNQIGAVNTLIVDAKFWKGSWYGVYTYWLGKNIKDTNGRQSYLAISIVIPNQYMRVVSSLYEMFETVCKSLVVGIYISSQGKYSVQNFSNNSDFVKLCDALKNVSESVVMNFDNSFKQPEEPEVFSYGYYSLLDCDSEACIEDLKKSRRVFVSKEYESKEQNLARSTNEIQELKCPLEQMKSKTPSNNTDSSTELNLLKSRVEELENEKSRLEQQLKINNEGDSVSKPGLLPFKVSRSVINLLLHILTLSVVSLNTCSIKNIENHLSSKANKNDAGQTDGTNDEDMDVDCKLYISKLGEKIKHKEGEVGTTYKISYETQEGYEFHTKNLDTYNDSLLREGEIREGEITFTPQKIDLTSAIIIEYRSSKNESNPKNKIVIN